MKCQFQVALSLGVDITRNFNNDTEDDYDCYYYYIITEVSFNL